MLDDQYFIVYFLNFNDIFTLKSLKFNKKMYHLISNNERYIKLFNFLKYFKKNKGFSQCQKFLIACEHGQLEMAKHLYNNGLYCNSTVERDIYLDYNYIFRTVCKNGYLEMAKWFRTLNVITLNDNLSFVVSCACNQLEVAKWLYSLGTIDIHHNNDYILKYSENTVKEWLQTINK